MVNTDPRLRAFLYRAVITNHRVEAMIADEQLLRPSTTELPTTSSSRHSPLDDFPLDARLAARRMGAVYELLYCLENSMRQLIESTLREALSPENWWEGVPDTIRKSADKRRADDARALWHGPRGESPLLYVDFPQLAEVILARWSDFEDLIGDRQWIERYFEEMNRSRRALAHTGALSDFDVERMEMRIREWLRVVG
jgi:hypothetical protein